jgi:hypothetical protein
MTTLRPDEESAKARSSEVAVSIVKRPSAILSAAAGLLLLCPLTLRAQDSATTMGEVPQVAIGQQFGPNGQIVNPDGSPDDQPPDDSSTDPNATSDDNNNDTNSDDNASNDNDSNDNGDQNNGDDAQSGNDDDSSQQQQPPDSNN